MMCAMQEQDMKSFLDNDSLINKNYHIMLQNMPIATAGYTNVRQMGMINRLKRAGINTYAQLIRQQINREYKSNFWDSGFEKIKRQINDYYENINNKLKNDLLNYIKNNKIDRNLEELYLKNLD